MSEYAASRSAITNLLKILAGNRPCQNLSLRLEKLNPTLADQDDRKAIRDELLGLLVASGRPPYDQSTLSVYIKALDKWRKLLAVQQAKHVELTLAEPLISGAGEKGVHEFGFYLQRLWGTPYIPGSGLKGIAARFAQDFGGPNWKPGGDSHSEMFGTTQLSGLVTFFDAWWIPSGSPIQSPFVSDIVTPHYQRYYEGDGWPHGMESPVPFPFPAVGPGERFLVGVAGAPTWTSMAFDILVSAITNQGVGTKTRTGYGRFEAPQGSLKVSYHAPPRVQ